MYVDERQRARGAAARDDIHAAARDDTRAAGRRRNTTGAACTSARAPRAGDACSGAGDACARDTAARRGQ